MSSSLSSSKATAADPAGFDAWGYALSKRLGGEDFRGLKRVGP